MEDSGIDSDSKVGSKSGAGQEDTISISSASSLADTNNCTDVRTGKSYVALQTSDPTEDDARKADQKSNRLQLHKRLEKHLESAKRFQPLHPLGGSPKNNCTTADKDERSDVSKKHRRKKVSKPKTAADEDETSQKEPLVQWENESEDEFVPPPLTKAAARELTQQLIKEGYHLQLKDEDEDLDLALPATTTRSSKGCCRSCVIS